VFKDAVKSSDSAALDDSMISVPLFASLKANGTLNDYHHYHFHHDNFLKVFSFPFWQEYQRFYLFNPLINIRSADIYHSFVFSLKVVLILSKKQLTILNFHKQMLYKHKIGAMKSIWDYIL
jgi:hypothetical protein